MLRPRRLQRKGMDARRKIQLPREQLLRLYGPSAADGRQPVAAAAAAALAAQPALAAAIAAATEH